MCIVGELGSGKTLTLTYLAWKNHFRKGRQVFSNYGLNGIPHTRIRSLADLEKMRDGFFAGDELWLWLDSRTSSKQMNKVTSDILLKSRKRGLTYCFTAQNMKQVDTRVRKVIDFTVYPVMTANERIVKALVFHGSSPDTGNFMRALRFRPKPVYKLYDSREEVKPLRQKNDIPFREIWNDERDLSKESNQNNYDII